MACSFGENAGLPPVSTRKGAGRTGKKREVVTE
jgi:hypothetical protein